MFPIDGHVHFHTPANVERTLAAAVRNLRSAVPGREDKLLGGLLLAEAAGEQVFAWLCAQANVGRWAVETVASERHSLWLADGTSRVLIVCGRQVRAAHGIEVLALGTDRRFRDREALESTIDHVRESGAIAALPWGFGKWIGRRGAIVRELLAAQSRDDLWLGDNGGRLRALRRPRLLEEGERRGMRVLPGSDPFPFGSDFRRVGGIGFLLHGPVDRARPWASIHAALLRLPASPPAFGGGTGWLRFGFNQLWIQVHTRLARRGTA
jgi:hypothetical protein